jgi:hypothetical protein
LAVLSVALRQAEECADPLAAKLELSEKAREKAEADAATAEDLRQRLNNAENALNDKIAKQIKREEGIIARFDTQIRRFVSKFFPFYHSSLSWFGSLHIDELAFCSSRKNG